MRATLWPAVLLITVVTCREFAAAQPAPQAIQAQVPKELMQPVTLESFREERLVQLLERLAKRTGFPIGLDDAGLEKLCKKPLKDVTIVPPPGELPIGAAVELVASQVHGTLREQNGRWRIVPGKSDISRFVPSDTAATRKAIQKMAEIEQPILDAPAKDIVEFLSEKYEMRIVIAPGPFDKSTKYGDQSCKLPVCKKPLIELVHDVARQIDGDVEVLKGLILIFPRSRNQS